MTKNEAKLKIREMLASGQKRADVFRELRGQGIEDKMLAMLISNYPSPERANKYRKHVYGIIAILLVQILITYFLLREFSLRGGELQSSISAITFVVVVIIQIIFIIGFYKNNVFAYIVFLFLSTINIGSSLAKTGFHLEAAEWASYAVMLAVVAYIAFVFIKIFPDSISVRYVKPKGEYVFTEDEGK
jgi:hypothetical protein